MSKLMRITLPNNTVLESLLKFYKVILAMGLIGLLGAAIFLAVTPQLYEVKGQIRLARVPANDKPFPYGVNLEESNLLIAHFNSSAAYSDRVVSACSENDQMYSKDFMNKIDIFPLKGSDSIIQVSVRMKDQELALNCVRVIYEAIKDKQNKTIDKYLDQPRVALTDLYARKKYIESLVADKSNSTAINSYLLIRDEMIFINNEIYRLKNLINARGNYESELVNLIYVKDYSVYPKKFKSLFIGFIAGLFLGAIYIIFINKKNIFNNVANSN